MRYVCLSLVLLGCGDPSPDPPLDVQIERLDERLSAMEAEMKRLRGEHTLIADPSFSLPIELPKSGKASKHPPSQRVILELRGEQVHHEGKVLNKEDRAALLRGVLKAHDDPAVLLRCEDPDVAQGRVVAIIDEIKEAGVDQIAIAYRPSEDEGPSDDDAALQE